MIEVEAAALPMPEVHRLAGGRGQPFISPPFDAAGHGYVEEEFLIEGVARLFALAPGSSYSFDGAWQTQVRGQVPYRTRIVVRRPADPVRFNGTAILLWNNVTAGFDNIRCHPEIYRDGYVLAGVSAQRVGLEGFDTADPKGLHAFDPERYGLLSIPTDDAGYDIFLQAGVALARSGDLVGGLRMERVLARGASQSAGRLSAFINGVAPHGHPFSGFMLDLRFGDQSPLETADHNRPGGITDLAAMVDGTLPSGTALLRDTEAPVFVLNTETEARSHAAVRQPDTDRYRLWEAAGLAHAGGAPASAAFQQADLPPNTIQIQPLRDAALAAMQRWMVEGIEPPRFARIALGEPTRPGVPPPITRDRDGMALGGLRLPQIAAPLACHTGTNTPGFAFLRGSSVPFSSEWLSARYGSPARWQGAYAQAIEDALRQGVLLPEGADLLREDAARNAPRF